MRVSSFVFIGLLAFGTGGTSQARADAPPVRQSGQSVNDPALREQPGLHPGTNFLFNGWGITPAGEPVTVRTVVVCDAVNVVTGGTEYSAPVVVLYVTRSPMLQALLRYATMVPMSARSPSALSARVNVGASVPAVVP